MDLNLIDRIRLMNRFNPMVSPSPMNPTSPMNPDQGSMVDSNVQSDPNNMNIASQDNVYNPPKLTSPAQDALFSTVSSMPNRSKFEPSKGRRLAAFLASLGAASPAAYEDGAALGFKFDPERAQKIRSGIIDEPYNEAMGDWNAKLKPLESAATIEERRNEVERQIANDYSARNIQDRRIGEQGRIADQRNQTQQDQLKEKYAYLDFKYYQQMHPNHKYQVDKDGYVYSIDPQSDTVDYPTDREGDYIKSDKLPEQQRLEIQNKNRINAISATGDQARQTEDVRQGNRVALKTTPPAASPNVNRVRTDLPTKATFARAQQAANSNPVWASYITLDKNGTAFNVRKPDKGDDATLKAINDFIYPSAPPSTMVRKREDGKVLVRRNGTLGYVTNPGPNDEVIK